jgi:hypothetical protein
VTRSRKVPPSPVARVSEVNLCFQSISTATDLGELLGGGLHVLDRRGQAGEGAGLLAVGRSRSLGRLGEEGEVQSPAFGLVGRRGGGVLASISDCCVAGMDFGLTLVSRACSQSSKALLRDAVLMAPSLCGVAWTCLWRYTPDAAPLRAGFLFPIFVMVMLSLDIA